MFFILSKILHFLTQPINWIVVLLLFGLFLKNGKWKKRCLRTGVVLLLVFSNPLLFNLFARWWEVETISPEEITASYDVAIVLGGYAGFQTYPSLATYNFSESVDRITTALELYADDKVKAIVLTGGSGSLTVDEPSEATAINTFLQKLNIPASAIWVEPDSRNTHENAAFTKELLSEKQPAARCLLITSAFHMRRAKACFEQVGLSCTPLSVDYMSEPQRWTPDALFLPSTSVLDHWGKLTKEWVGYVVYWAQGYI